MKRMKILMIGLGSIGQRHVRNIRRIYGNNVEIIAFRERGLSHTFSDDMKIRDNVCLEEEFSILSYKNIEEALSTKPDVAFITNITSKHIQYAIQAATYGCDLFLEKPLSNTMEGVEELESLVKEKNLIVFMGFQNRYHPCLVQAKKMLEEKTIGNIVSVSIEMGERLTTMHSYEDYAETYMARLDMGGGVVLNQQIHEIDYVNWLLGVPVSVYAVGGKTTDLNIDVEDNASSMYSIKQETGTFPVYMHADFIQYPPKRTCKIIGTNGVLEFDLISNKLVTQTGEHTAEIRYDDFVRNDMFIQELKDFFESVNNRKPPYISLKDGIAGLRVAIATKTSMKNNAIIKL